MEILTEMGLTTRESQIYRLLLRIGESPISAVLKATKAHPQVVYRTIDNLVAKGLVGKVHRQHKAFVRAETPKRLEKLEEERLRKIREVIPELLALQKPSKDAVVRVSRGEEAVRALRTQAYEELPKNGTYYIIGGTGDRFYQIMDDRYAETERKRIKKKIHRKLIAFADLKPQLQKDAFQELSEFRYLPDTYPVQSSINIFLNTVAIMIWAPEPIIVTIESEEAAESYKKYFYLLWHIASGK